MQWQQLHPMIETHFLNNLLSLDQADSKRKSSAEPRLKFHTLLPRSAFGFLFMILCHSTLLLGLLLGLLEGRAWAAESNASISKQVKKLTDRQKRFLNCRKDGDCTTLAYGNAPCGGPAAYLIVNLQGSQDSQLKKLAAEISAAQAKAQQQQQGLAGICMLTPEPATHCAKRICQAAQENL